MGLLDEAIREHLELKRLRGADPVDVARMEREALGPARRPDSEAEALSQAGAPFDADSGGSGAAGAGSLAAEPQPGSAEADYGAAPSDLEPVPPSSSVYEERPERAADFDEEPPPAASHADEAPPEPADWSDHPSRRPPSPVEDEYEPAADDRSIAPASYGQETAEFDVESAVLGHERAATPSPASGPGEAGAAPGPHAADLADEPPIAPPPAPDEPGRYGEVVADEPSAEPDAGGTHPEAEGERSAFVDEPTQLHPQAAPPRPAEPAHPMPAPARGPGQPEAEQEPEEDVLEETPDFLQETPEHERLWFEQRPPRDFDFDK